MKKQNKWLDNFGKADNANNSKVSMSEDFVGLSYDTKGRNYSPAWGGQFEHGGEIAQRGKKINQILNANKNLDWVKGLYDPNYGSIQIPGQEGRSTHFMESSDGRAYPTVVRMADGKLKYLGDDAYDYADKTKTYIQFPSDREAQLFSENYKKGTNVLKDFQIGGKLNPISPTQQIQQAVEPTPTVPYLQTKDPAEFYKAWIQTPEYERRLKATGYSDVPDRWSVDKLSEIEKVKKERLNLLENIKPLEYDPSKRSEAILDYYDGSTINVNPSDYKTFSKQSVEAHEIAHVATPQGTMGGNEFGIFMGSMLPSKKPIVSGVQGSKEREASKEAVGDYEHLQKPWEAKADLDALRFMMYDKGIYDITKGKKFTEKDFEKVKQSFGKERVFKRFTDKMGKENFVKLMNTIALVDDQEEAPIAMGGMSIPGSVGFTYARVAGAAPSKGKYAKKTMASAQNGIMSPMLLARNVLNYFYPSEEAVPTVAAAPVEYKKGLTDELLKRQAYKESTFNPAAVSPAGYKGLTQIGESVLKDYSKKKGGKKLDPFNPEDAVELQKFAMDDLYNASFINKPNQPDSVRLAKTLAAYNWGRGNLANYLNEQKSKGIDIYDSYDWLNNLPKETSDYVNKILLQEDPSFNKNYKKASTNPKYEDITSLYDQKMFGGDIPSAQKGKNDVEKISINDPRYPELHKNRQVGAYYDGAYSLPDLDEVTVTAPRSYTIDSLRDFTTAALYGAPANAMKLSMIPQAAMTEGIEALRGEPYDFSNVNPNFGEFTSNQRDLSQTMGYENPEGFLQNAANIALSTIDPALITGGAGMLKKPLQKQLAKSLSKNFKSEIDWAKWNKEIPENTELMKEYNAIEQTSKANNTWMKNPDGSKFKGTPEQFVQENSKNFKNSNLNSNKTYRVNFRGGDNNPIIHDPSSNIAFTGDKKSARTYAYFSTGDRNSPLLSAIDPPSTRGFHELYATGNKRLNIDAKNSSYDNVFYDGKNNKTYRIAEESFLNPEINNVNILNVKNHLEGPTSIFEKIIGRKYGNELINKQVSGNYLKSARGNNGMFDMTNPNIYKALVPTAIAAGAIPKKQNGGEMKFYQNGLDWKPKSMQDGGITRDNQGYWNPDNWGQPVEIDSNDITMEGVYEPLLGVSDTGDTKLMKPGKNYKFKGKKVTEYPVAKLGINQLDAQPMKKLNQLLNFTNNPDKDNWLDKYN